MPPRELVNEFLRNVHQTINQDLHCPAVPVFIVTVTVSAHSLIGVDPVVPQNQRNDATDDDLQQLIKAD